MKNPDQGALFGEVTPEEKVRLDEERLKKEFAEYWAESDVAWDGERLYRTIIAIGKRLMVDAAGPVPPHHARVTALGRAGELFCRLLNKHMPDLKAVEHSGKVGMTQESAVDELMAGISAAEEALDRVSALRSDPPPDTH